MAWLEQQGPWCPALLDDLSRNARGYDALIFFTYLYAPTVLGLQVAPERSILAPTAHKEPAITLDIYKDVFSRPAAIAFNTEVERAFLTSAFQFGAIAEETIGCGVELLEGTDEFVRDLTVERLPGVSHWVQQEAPQRVNPILKAWLSAPR